MKTVVRTLTAAFAALCISSAAQAAEKCTTIRTKPKDMITAETKGYVPVKVTITIPVGDKDATQEAKKGKYRLALRATSPKFRLANNADLEKIEVCTREVITGSGEKYRVSTTWLTVIGKPVETGDNDYVLGSGLPMPADFVAQAPIAEMCLDSKVCYKGEWGKSAEGFTSLSFREIKKSADD